MRIAPRAFSGCVHGGLTVAALIRAVLSSSNRLGFGENRPVSLCGSLPNVRVKPTKRVPVSGMPTAGIHRREAHGLKSVEAVR